MSMSQIAKAIGVSKPTIYRYANGTMQPDMDVWGRTIQFAKKQGQREIVGLLLTPFSEALATSVPELEKVIGRRAA